MQEITKIIYKLPQSCLDLINQLFEIEKKSSQLQESNSISRNISRIKNILEEELFKQSEPGKSFGVTYYNPINESFNESRTDCEAKIAGTGTENLIITEVIKPIIYCSYDDNGRQMKTIAQKGLVIVQSKNN